MYNFFLEPPVFTHKAKDFESIREGSTLSLQCTASGEPKANIQWTRKEHQNDSSEILKVSGSGLLEVANIKRNQAGNYTCSATNPAGTESHTTVVEVQCKCLAFSCKTLKRKYLYSYCSV